MIFAQKADEMTEIYLPQKSIDDDYKIKLKYALKWMTFGTTTSFVGTFV